MKKLLLKLNEKNILDLDEIEFIYRNIDEDDYYKLLDTAYIKKQKYYGDDIYLRGLIEFSNICNRKCLYCGISSLNNNIDRFRLSIQEIKSTIDSGYNLGFRTFVLQAGEDKFFNDEILMELIREIKNKYMDLAITLSLGERDYESYKNLFEAGADRYLLRHETISEELFNKIHKDPNYRRRIDSLYELKKIGYQVGAGFMVGIPGESYMDLSKDILFIKELNPEMVGIGPFIPHQSTIYKNSKPGKIRDTIISLALVRHMVPDILLPATTALSTLDKNAKSLGFKAGANVIMPNLSPSKNIDSYSLYNNKLNTGLESSNELDNIKKYIKNEGYNVDMRKGNSYRWGD